jgi:hypothetical protein
MQYRQSISTICRKTIPEFGEFALNIETHKNVNFINRNQYFNHSTGELSVGICVQGEIFENEDYDVLVSFTFAGEERKTKFYLRDLEIAFISSKNLYFLLVLVFDFSTKTMRYQWLSSFINLIFMGRNENSLVYEFCLQNTDYHLLQKLCNIEKSNLGNVITQGIFSAKSKLLPYPDNDNYSITTIPLIQGNHIS